jgi:hypothetical protein
MEKFEKITIQDIVTNVVQTTHLEPNIAKEAVLSAVGGIRYVSMGKPSISVKVGSQGVELENLYDNEDLTENVVAGSPIDAEDAVRVVNSVGETISEHLANTERVDVEDLGTFERRGTIVVFEAPKFKLPNS